MDKILEELVEIYGNNYWINSMVAKGQIVITWRNEKPWIVADKKTKVICLRNLLVSIF